MKNLFLSGIMILALALSSCKDFLDINQNPNNTMEVSINSILSAGHGYSTVALGYTTQLAGAFWVQHYTQNTSANQYVTLRDYNLTYSSTYLTAQWVTTYRQTIPSLRDLKAQAEKERITYKEYAVYTAVSEIMEAFHWHILNSLYDRVCYAEGQQGMDNLTPEFESSRASYELILKLYEKVLEYDVEELQDYADKTFAGTGRDMIFDGDMEAWMQFANTVYLKMLMRDFTANQSKIQAVLNSPIGLLDEHSGDAKFAYFQDLPDKSNPLYEGDRRQLNSTQNIKACNSLLGYLTTKADPRRTVFYDTNSGGGYSGGAYAAGAGGATSRAKLAATDPVYFASVAEAYFLKAEAYARLNDPTKAKANYDAGVIAAFNRWNLNGDPFIETGGAYEFQTGTIEEMIEQIIIQKWVASTRCQAWDAWFDLNRTGYPRRAATTNVATGELLQAFSGLLDAGTYPQRFLYPKNSSDYNPNTPTAVKMNEKLWWQK